MLIQKRKNVLFQAPTLPAWACGVLGEGASSAGLPGVAPWLRGALKDCGVPGAAAILAGTATLEGMRKGASLRDTGAPRREGPLSISWGYVGIASRERNRVGDLDSWGGGGGRGVSPGKPPKKMKKKVSCFEGRRLGISPGFWKPLRGNLRKAIYQSCYSQKRWNFFNSNLCSIPKKPDGIWISKTRIHKFSFLLKRSVKRTQPLLFKFYGTFRTENIKFLKLYWHSMRFEQMTTLFQTIFQLVTQSLEERNVELAGQQLADFCRKAAVLSVSGVAQPRAHYIYRY